MERGSVLIVDDDPELREALVAGLFAAGFSAHAVADGQSAMQALAGRAFEAVCLDVILPDVSGYEVCEWLRARPEGEAAVVVMISARASPIDEAMALECGADQFLAKPFELPALIAAIRASARPAVRNAVA